MKTLRHCFAATARLMAWPLLVAVAMSCLCMWATRGSSATEADRFAGLWLHLPAFLLTATCFGAALEAWPLYSRTGPGQSTLLRLARGPLQGCGAALLGALLALGLGLALSGAIFEAVASGLRTHEPDVRAYLRFVPQTRADLVLDQRHPSVRLVSGSDLVISSLRLKPLGAMSASTLRPARIRVRAGDRELHEGWLEVFGDEVQLEVSPPRPLPQLVIERHPRSGLALIFHDHAVRGRSVQTHGGLANCLLAILAYLLPAALGLAVMAVGRAHLTLPVAFAAGFVTLLLTTLLELTPNTAAVTAYARGHWLPAEGLGTRAAASLGAVGLILLLAYLVGKLRRT